MRSSRGLALRGSRATLHLRRYGSATMTKAARAEIDRDTVRGLLLLNGGGSLALLALLPRILEKPPFRPLVYMILVALSFYLVGLVCAVAHNHLRRRCSLVHSQHGMRPPPGRLFGRQLPNPTVCFFSWLLMFVSLAVFAVGGVAVIVGAAISIPGLPE